MSSTGNGIVAMGAPTLAASTTRNGLRRGRQHPRLEAVVGVGGADVHRRHGHAFPELGDVGGYARSTRTCVPERTFLKRVGSPATLPKTLTGLAGRISSPRLEGVGPKKMQKAAPGGQ